MDQLPFDNLEQIAQVLKVTFTGDTQTIKQATDILDSMAAANYGNFAKNLFEIVNSPNCEDAQMRIKNSAIVTLTRITLANMKNNVISAEHRNYAIKGVIESLYSEFITLPMKVNLQYFLLLLYTMDVGSQMLNEGLMLVKEKLSSKNLGDYPPTFLILQSLINTTQVPQESVSQWFEELSAPMIEIGGGLTQGLLEEIQAIVQIEDVQKQEEKLAGILTGLKVLKLWLVTLQEFFKLLGNHEPEEGQYASYLKVLVTNERLSIVLVTILMLNFNVPTQIKDCLISTSGKQEADDLINTIKSSVFKCFNKAIDCLGATLKVCNIDENHFFKVAQTYMLGVSLHTLIVYCKTPDAIENVSKFKDANDLLIDCLNLLNRVISFPVSSQIFAAIGKTLVVDVCLALMRPDAKELEDFKENPSEFVALSTEITKTKNTSSLKVQASKLLARLAVNADGILTHTIKVILALIEFSMVSNKLEELGNFKDLAEHIDAFMITKTDPIIRVETCLLALAALHKEIVTRKDILPMIGELLKVCQQFFLGPETSGLIKARVCLMLPYYAGFVFQGEANEEVYKEYIKFVLQCLMSEGEGAVVLSEQGSASLYAMFESVKTAASLTAYTADILMTLTMLVENTKNFKVFDVLYEIVTEFEMQMMEEPQAFLDMIKALVERGHREFQILQSNTEATKLYLNKIWNIIRGIAGRDEYVITLQEDIEEIIEPLFAYFEQSKTIGFDEDILNYIASATACKEEVSPATWKVFASFPKMFEQYEQMLAHLFPPLNKIIVYGSKTINSDPGSIQTLIEMGVQALNPKCKQADEANVTEGALLLHLILQYLDPITEAQFEMILTASFERLSKVPSHYEYLRARLGGVFLCAFMKNFEVSQQILLKIGGVQPIMDLFLKHAIIFEETPYDRRLLNIGLSSILLNQNICDEITSRFAEIFDIIISLLRFVEYMERFEFKNNELLEDSDDSEVGYEMIKTNRNILRTFLDNKKRLDQGLEEPGDDIHEKGSLNKKKGGEDDSSDEDDKHLDYVPGRSEANNITKNMVTELTKQDEFELFKKGIMAMRDTRVDILQNLVVNLPEKKREFLKEVLQSQRIQLGYGGEGRLEARRIVKPSSKRIANVEFVNGEFQKAPGPQ